MSEYEYGPHFRMPKYCVPLFGLPMYPGKPRPGSADYDANLAAWEKKCAKIDAVEAVMFFGLIAVSALAALGIFALFAAIGLRLYLAA